MRGGVLCAEATVFTNVMLSMSSPEGDVGWMSLVGEIDREERAAEYFSSAPARYYE
jgi:hypothetical protein